MNGLKSRILFLVFVIFTISLIETIQIADAEIFVNPGNFTQDVITSANSGDVINFTPGTYVTNINIELLNNVTLTGTDAIIRPDDVLDWNALDHTTDRKVGIRIVNSSDIIINDFTFDFIDMPRSSAVVGLMYANSTGQITNNNFENLEVLENDGVEFMIYMQSLEPFDESNRMQVLVQDNTLIESGRIGIYARDFVNATIDNNTITNNNSDFGYGIELVKRASGTITNNVISGYNRIAPSDTSISAGIYFVSNVFAADQSTPLTVSVIIDNNEVSDSVYGLYIGTRWCNLSPTDIDLDATITNNNLHDNTVGGLRIASCNADEGQSIIVNAHDNTISKNGQYGFHIANGELNGVTNGNVTTTMHDNVITKHNQYGVFLTSFPGGNLTSTTNATENYWGHPQGPMKNSTSPGKRDSIFGSNITLNPWFINQALNNLFGDTSVTKLELVEDVVEFDSSNNGEVEGQVSLPENVEEIVLKNNAVLNVTKNTVNADSNDDIVIGNQTQNLKNFTSKSLNNVNLKEAKSVGDKKVIVTKVVKMKSGIVNNPIIIKNIALPSVSVAIPDETTILAPDSWNGIIQPPKSISNSGNAPSGFTVGDAIIEVGSPGAILLFDTPVTLTLSGVTGTVGYKPSGSNNWIQITNTCDSFDNPATGLVFPGECFINNGVDTKIATFHFTGFGPLDPIPPPAPTPAKSSSGGSGRTNVSPEEIAKKSSTSLSRVGDWVSSKDYFKIGMRDLISKGHIENVSTIPTQSPPDWFYSTGQAWSDGEITNEEYFNAVKYLIDYKILK